MRAILLMVSMFVFLAVIISGVPAAMDSMHKTIDSPALTLPLSFS